jgi:hypothetical protein
MDEVCVYCCGERYCVVGMAILQGAQGEHGRRELGRRQWWRLWWTRKHRSGHGDFVVPVLPVIIVGQEVAIAADDLVTVSSARSQVVAPVVAIQTTLSLSLRLVGHIGTGTVATGACARRVFERTGPVTVVLLPQHGIGV